jgi:hypothetical protein
MSFGKGYRLSLLGVFIPTVLVAFSGWSMIRRDDVLDSSYLALGADGDYAAVGSFVNSWGYTGSGILIAPDWVLTAAHNLVLATSATFTLNGTPYTSDQLLIHPNWQSGNSFAGYDVGLVHLTASVYGVAPAVLYTGPSESGEMATFVGYGFVGTGLTGYQTVDGQRRACQNMIDGDFGNPLVLLASDFDNPHTPENPFGDPTPLGLEGSVAPGDSGGGVFVKVSGQSYLAGVISFVAATDGSANGDYGDVNGFGRVTSFDSWVRANVPEPSSTAVLVLAGLAMLLVRRHRVAKAQIQP